MEHNEWTCKNSESIIITAIIYGTEFRGNCTNRSKTVRNCYVIFTHKHTPSNYWYTTVFLLFTAVHFIFVGTFVDVIVAW